MTRKDYVKIAAILLTAYGDVTTINSIIRRIANMLSEDNPRFDRARFYQACGFQVPPAHAIVPDFESAR